MIQPAETPLAHRVEEASLNAWPALQQHLFDGWLLRFNRGFTKRANSVVPLHPSTLPLVEKVRYCEAEYARARLRTVFRLTTLADHAELDALLEARSYQRLEQAQVLCRPLGGAGCAPRVAFVAKQAWLTAYAALTGMPQTAARLHELVLSNISQPCAFALILHDDKPAACGLAVLEHELVGLFDVIIEPTLRGRGLGRQVVEDLLAWGSARGARHAYLQVVTDNSPASALYASLGFTGLYTYWYRAST